MTPGPAASRSPPKKKRGTEKPRATPQKRKAEPKQVHPSKLNLQVSHSGYDEGKESQSDDSKRSQPSKKEAFSDEPQNLAGPQIVVSLEAGQDKGTPGEQVEEMKAKQFKEDKNSSQDENRPKEQTCLVKAQEEGKQENSSSQSDDEEEEEDDIQHNEPASNVVESSPKERFCRYNEELGRGAYKIVYRGGDTETGREIAWNVVNLRRLSKQDRIRIKSEIDLIKKLQHKNIIHFISAWINKQKDQVVFITELISGGTLRKYVKRIRNIKLKVIKRWCKEVLEGLIYLHEQKPHPIIHRDLKCDNVFINASTGEIRIGDLGLSTPMQNSYSTSVLGTPEFMAPELYEECYGTGVDIYAFGMCVLEMVTLERPYKECNNPAQIYNKVIKGILPQALERIDDDEVKEFIMLCLSNANDRPSARILLESKFLADFENERNMRVVKVLPPSKPIAVRRDSIMRQSVIQEVAEEENTDEDTTQGKVVEEQKQLNEQHEEENKANTKESSDSSSVTSDDQPPQKEIEEQAVKVEENQEQEQEPQIQEEEEEKKEEEVKLPEAQLENDSDQENPSNERDSTNDKELEKQKKRQMKNQKRNQKLDESFSFLKKIDKEKHRKLRRQSQCEFDALIGTGQSKENILDDLNHPEKKDKKQIQNNALMIEKKKNFKEDGVSTPSQPHSSHQPHQAPNSNFSLTCKSKMSHQDQNKSTHQDQVKSSHQESTKSSHSELVKSSHQELNKLQHQDNGRSIDSEKKTSQPQCSLPKSISKDQNNKIGLQRNSNLALTKSSNALTPYSNTHEASNLSKKGQFDVHSGSAPYLRNPQHLTGPAHYQEPRDSSDEEDKDSEVERLQLDTPTHDLQIRGQKNHETLETPSLRTQNSNVSTKLTSTPQGSKEAHQERIKQANPTLSQARSYKSHDDGDSVTYQRSQQKPIHHQKKEQHSIQSIPKDPQNAPAKHLPKPEHQGEHQNINLGTIPMKLKILLPDGSEQEVAFSFDTNNDTPIGVAEEMVKELALPPGNMNSIAKHIHSEIEHKYQQLMAHKIQAPKHPPQQLPPPQKKASPAKLTKDQAFGYFMELLQAIDGFQSNLGGKGINCEEFLEALDIQEEERQLKFDFLTSLHNLRSGYKGKMEDYKKRVQKKKLAQHNGPEQKPSLNQNGQALPMPKVTQGQPKPPQNGSHQNKRPELPKPKKISREGSTNDIPMLGEHDHLHRHVNFNPVIPQKLQSILYQGNLNQSEEDVTILQNLLSIIYHVSLNNQYPTQETFQFQYVKIDGHFGERTKQLVMKFQESAGMTVDGIVNEHLWKKLVHSHEKLQKEELARRHRQKKAHHNNGGHRGHYLKVQHQSDEEEVSLSEVTWVQDEAEFYLDDGQLRNNLPYMQQQPSWEPDAEFN